MTISIYQSKWITATRNKTISQERVKVYFFFFVLIYSYSRVYAGIKCNQLNHIFISMVAFWRFSRVVAASRFTCLYLVVYGVWCLSGGLLAPNATIYIHTLRWFTLLHRTESAGVRGETQRRRYAIYKFTYFAFVCI